MTSDGCKQPLAHGEVFTFGIDLRQRALLQGLAYRLSERYPRRYGLICDNSDPDDSPPRTL